MSTIANRAARPCKYPGCIDLSNASSAYCTEHLQEANRSKRNSNEWVRLYSTKQWRTLRRYVLDNEPICRECKARGLLRSANVVDHIIAHKGNRQLFSDIDNLRPLCKSCHDRHTATHDGGFGNRKL